MVKLESSLLGYYEDYMELFYTLQTRKSSMKVS